MTADSHAPPALLLLYADRADAAASAILDHAPRFGRDVIAISLRQLVERVVVDRCWTFEGRMIEPSRTAVVNRLTSFAMSGDGRQLESFFAQKQLWSWLHRELQRFCYVSSLPTATSLIGCYGSLLDQWTDLPLLVDGLLVPLHRAPGSADVLQGDVHVVNPWHLYSLGRRPSPEAATQGVGQLAYVRPRGYLVHLAQVGATMMFANAPPQMSAGQRDAMVAFARAMEVSSASRILEHAFFVGDDAPVFYSTCPMPVVSGSHPAYADLVIEGLKDDIERRRRRIAP